MAKYIFFQNVPLLEDVTFCLQISSRASQLCFFFIVDHPPQNIRTFGPLLHKLLQQPTKMNDAIRLNNEAIEMLARCSDETHMQECIALFTLALRRLKVILVNDDAKKNNPVHSSENETSSRQPQASGCSLAAITDSPCALMATSDTSGDSHYVYQRLFRLFPNNNTLGGNAIQIYIACVIFNIAFIHQHQTSLFEPLTNRTHLLEKSALLYKSCFQILLSLPPADSDDVTFLLKVGALNNSAQILYDCGQFEQACHRLEMVEGILCAQGLSETQCCFTVQEFEGILANVLLLKPPTVAVAA